MNLDKAIPRDSAQVEENAAAPEYVHSMILRPGRRNHSQRAFPWITLICWLAIAVLAAAAICEVLK